MAVIKCAECGRQVSTLADACPHCGAPVTHSVKTTKGEEETEDEEKDRSGLILKIFLVIVALGLVYVFFKDNIDPHVKKWVAAVWNTGSNGDSNGPDPAVVNDPENPVAPPDIADRDDGKIMSVIPNGNELDPDDDGPAPSVLAPPDKDDDDSGKPKSVVAPPDEPTTKIDPDAVIKPEPLPRAPDQVKAEADPPQSPTPPKPEEPETAKTPPEPAEPPKAETAEPAPAKVETKPQPEVGDKRIRMVLDKTADMKPAIVKTARVGEEGKLLVTVNDDWKILSCPQKQEAAKTIRKAWVEVNGKELVLVDEDGSTVASENHNERIMSGSVRFIIKGCK